MKTIISALLLIGTLGAHSGVHAQNSTLRVACKGNDVGAEVTIDGQFKGECPLEARVRAGTVKLRLVKKVDSLRERVFEQDIRLGDGVVKQIDVVLSAPRLIAGGQGGESKPPAAESPETGRRAQADTAATQESAPPRPPIPLAISEDIWKIIEASEAYRNLPQPRAIKAVFQSKQETEYTGSKSRSLPNPGAKTISTTRVTAPIGDKCTMILTDSVTDGKPDGASGSYYCGLIWLGSTSGGKPGMTISSIDELKGSLFPMRVGARQTKRFQMAFVADRKYDSTHASDCAVVGRLAAQELDPRLAGAAWKVHCKSSYNSGNETETDDYYLEDLAVMLSSIGAYDSSKKAHVLPSAGTQTVIEAEGDYGSRNTTSYASYNWETGGTYEVPAQIAAVAAPSSDGRPAAARDEPAQREQPQLAGLSDEETPAQQLKAAAAGDASAMANLGVRYETGKGVAQSYAQAARWYQKAAEAGDSAGMGGLGSMYLNGTGLPKDPEQARIWFSKSAEAGNGRGMNGIGVLYARGDGGIPKDITQAVAWYEKAAAAGEWRAMTNLGNIYAGESAVKNDNAAVSWYRKAADIGSPVGMFSLGAMYANGQGVAKNDVEAVSWYRKAAAAGSVKGMFELGTIYANGQGVAKDETEAVSWHRKAALAGHALAMTSLGFYLHEGRGAPKNEAEGLEWTRRAAALGEAHATRNLEAWRTEQARRNSPQNAGTAQAEKPASSGSGFFGAMIGSLASRVVDRTASQINSAAAGSGNAALGALASANTQLANATKEQIARDMGGNGSVEGVAGAVVGGALGSGSRAGAMAALSGATDQARGNSPQNSSATQAAQPAGTGSGFFGAALGGVASGLLDRNAAMLNSAAASTGGASGAVMGALGNVNTQLARETREKIARDMGGNGGVEGAAGVAVGSALGSGSMAGAVSALSGATNNLAGSAPSGSAGSGTDSSWALFGAAGGGCCSSASERLADNRARGAPDGFETNNERICRERKSRAHCEAGVTERRLNLGGLEKFGRPSSGGTVASAPDKATAAQEQTCRAAYRGVTGDPQFDWACRNAQFNSCLDEATRIPTYKVQTQAVCRQLDKTLRALNSGTAASYCPLYCGRQ